MLTEKKKKHVGRAVYNAENNEVNWKTLEREITRRSKLIEIQKCNAVKSVENDSLKVKIMENIRYSFGYLLMKLT